MKSLIRPAVALLLFIGFFLGFYLLVPYVLYFTEQHHLFVFTAEYFTHAVHFKGLFYTLTAFFIQFNAVPALGAAVWALILVLIYLMLQSVAHSLTGLNDRLQLTALPSIYLFYKMTELEYFPQPVVQTLVWTAAAWIAALALGRFLPWRKPKKADTVSDREEGTPKISRELTPRMAAGSVLLAAVYMTAAYLGLVRPVTGSLTAQTESMMLETQRMVGRGQWKEALGNCEKWAATGRKNHLMSYFRTLSLSHLGLLNDHLFDHPQTFGLKALFFPWLGNKNQAEYGNLVFEHLGAVNPAHRWTFEAMVGLGETAPIVRNMARYNIVMGRPRVAARYINILDHTLFYRDEARRLRSQLEAGRVDGLRDALAAVPHGDVRWDNVLNIGADARYIVTHDPGNTVARDYLLNAMLLAGNIEAFVRNLTELMPATSHPVLPRYFQQALMIYGMINGQNALDSLGYSISPDVVSQFREFMTVDAKGKAAIFSPELRRTYWYYIRKTLPKVNHNFSRDKKPQVQS